MSSEPVSIIPCGCEREAQIVEELRFGIVAVDRRGVVVLWNEVAESLFGIAKRSTLGQTFRSLPLPWEWSIVEPYLSAVTTTLEPVRSQDISYVRGDGARGLLGLTLTPLRDINGARDGFVLTAADVSQRRELEHQLQEANKLEAVGRLAAGVAHEINTPVQFIGDNLRFIEDAFRDVHELLEAYRTFVSKMESSPEAQTPLRLLSEATERLEVDYLLEEIPNSVAQSLDGVERVAEIVRAMKEFSHPAGERTQSDLNRALKQTSIVTRNEWKYVADLVLDLDTSAPLVCCHLGELSQAFVNLIVNAAHAINDRYGTDSGNDRGEIRLTTRAVGSDAIEIEVGDTGAGMADEVRRRCFEQFFTTKEVGKGTGQGLAQVHRAVSGHGGTVRVESQLGEGTRFIIHLPVGDGSD